jgi:tRNA 2-selenouridine synthase
MNDDERHQVGIRYKQEGQQSAIELGHQLVSGEIKARRVQSWVDFARANPHGALYCFRGGLRSQIAQSWLHEAGISYPRITGGYKAMRQFLIQQLEQSCATNEFVLVGGLTGCGKTDVIDALAHAIDLERLAQHRGSSFGGRVERQPAQIDFENQLSIALLKLAERGVTSIAIEDEAHLIGRCAVPIALRERTAQAEMVWVTGHLEDRVARILRDYIDNLKTDYQSVYGLMEGFDLFRAHLTRSLHNLRKRLGMQRYADLDQLLQKALDYQASTDNNELHVHWITPLMVEYYDPMYSYQRSQKSLPATFEGSVQEVIAYLKSRGH